MKNIYTKILSISFFILIGMSILMWMQFKNFAIFKDTSSVALKIKHLDEVLTMSARMAAFTGDQKWIKRYNENAPQLDNALAEAKKDIEILNYIQEIDSANTKLIEMETKSFELVETQKFVEAQNLLSSQMYQKYKNDYAKGLEKIIEHLNTKQNENTNQLSLNYQGSLVLNTILLIIAMGFGIYIINILQQYNNKLVRITKKLDSYVGLIDKNIITSTTDLDGNITDVSEYFCKISGYEKKELLGKNHKIIRHPDMDDTLFKDLWITITSNQTWQGEIKNRTKNGGYYWVDATISPVFNDGGEKTGYTAIRQEITNKKQIEELSITDALTNIYNRRHFNEMFPKIINSAKRDNDLVSFVIMDIDHFKQYNDTYGHQKGDEVLVEFANALKSLLHRADDLCFRLGGEEFGVIFKVDSKNKALEFANLIRANIEDLKIVHEGNSASSYVTASMGLVCKNAKEINSDDGIYKEADDLLYKAKESGRNRVCSNISDFS